MNLTRIGPALAASCLVVLAASPAFAQPGPHPESLRAIADLRAARQILSQPGRMGPLQSDSQAIATIDTILRQTERVAEADHRDPRRADGMQPDVNPTGPGRHENALQLLMAAKRDLDIPESTPAALPYRQQARYQLEEVINNIRTAMAHRR